ncbi:hypothetical protein [Micromonospora sp. NPDC005172]|uniref:hypothetical protein n=1 Tax=Micromonospora sp. NPDC005172 TaxID=3156867 RepID=UPI0033B0D035
MAALLALTSITSCSSKTEPADPYSAEIRRAAATATSDFEKEALSDSKVSRAEYEEAVSRFIECVRQKGVAIEKIDQFGYYIYETITAPNALAAQDECNKGTKAVIEPLYVSRLTNPNKADPNQLFAACLLKHGAAPAGYSAETAKRDKSESFANAPYDSSDPRVTQCLANPVL